MSVPTTHRDHLTTTLERIRRDHESSRLNRLWAMQHARANGLSCHEIAVLLGITESGVRKAISRAGGHPL